LYSRTGDGFFDSRGDTGERIARFLQGSIAWLIDRQIGQIDIHRQARHVPHKQIDGRSAL
jgi:hypothetical protein